MTKPNQGGGITYAEVENRPPIRLDTHEEMVEACSDTIMDRSTKAKDAPICQGVLFDLLGYNLDGDGSGDLGRPFQPAQQHGGLT